MFFVNNDNDRFIDLKRIKYSNKNIDAGTNQPSIMFLCGDNDIISFPYDSIERRDDDWERLKGIYTYIEQYGITT